MTPAPNTDNIPRCSRNRRSAVEVEIDDHRVNPSTDASFNPFDVADRLKTFNSKWPVPFIRTEEMAEAGFMYTNLRDIVECPYCKIRVGQWVEDDVPFSEHEKHSPNCQFVIDSKRLFHPSKWTIILERCFVAVSSFLNHNFNFAAARSREQPSSPQSPPTNSGEDTCGLGGIECSRNDPVLELQHMSKESIMQKLNVNATARPIANKYVNLKDRLGTYENWPSIGPKLTPERLSEAGFVCAGKFRISLKLYSKYLETWTNSLLMFAGESDRVWCFHCGGTLCTWDSSDDPWVEHAHWFPNCKYVRFVKGQQFIDCARLKKKEDLSKTEEVNKYFVGKYSRIRELDYQSLNFPLCRKSETLSNCSKNSYRCLILIEYTLCKYLTTTRIGSNAQNLTHTVFEFTETLINRHKTIKTIHRHRRLVQNRRNLNNRRRVQIRRRPLPIEIRK